MKIYVVCTIGLLLISCSDDSLITNTGQNLNPISPQGNNGSEEVANPSHSLFNNTLDLNSLYNYEDQTNPAYIRKDNTRNNEITNEGATLGRVLFYDEKLSVDNSISCASCHQQNLAFGDNDRVSQGVNGVTERHSMRLINSRFATERRFFWDERAGSLEVQTTMPIQDHAEMGFSGDNGDPSFVDLIGKLRDESYYQELFSLTYGDADITEIRIQNALAQFIRSIESFDSKYDEGRSRVNNDNQNFPNFTVQENRGKQLFMGGGNGGPGNGGPGNGGNGGLGCVSCHRAPEFDIDPGSRNNGVINTAANDNGRDLNNTRSATLRDMFNANGVLHGPLMHTGRFENMESVLEHYSNINPNGNNNLDQRLRRRRNINAQQRDDLIAFLKTLTGSKVYSDDRWSDPFIR